MSELKVGDRVLHTLKNASPSDAKGRKRPPMEWRGVVVKVHRVSFDIKIDNGPVKRVRPESLRREE